MQSSLILLQSNHSLSKREYRHKQEGMPANMNKQSFIKGLKNRCSHLLRHPKATTEPSQLVKAKPRGHKLLLNPTREEALKWAESLDDLMSHKYGLIAFRNFLKSEYNDENIDFWLACEDYKKIISPTKRAAKAQKIFSDFVEPMSPKELNLDYYTKDNITQNLQHPSCSCFEAAQKKVYALMENNCYARFLQSDLYQNILNSTQGHQQT